MESKSEHFPMTHGSSLDNDIASPSGEGTSGTSRPTPDNNQLKDMVMQMQNQMQTLIQKMNQGETPEKILSVDTNIDIASTHDFEDAIDLDYEDDFQDLLNAAQVDSSDPMSEVISVKDNSSEVSILNSLVSDLNYDSITGSNVVESLAKVVDNMCSRKLPQTKFKEKLDKYPRPGNISALQVTQVNQLVWDNLQPATKSRDLSIQKIQNVNVKAMIALTTLLNEMIVGKSGLDKENLMAKLTDALALMGMNSMQVNTLRRDLIKPEIKTEFKAICSKGEPSSTFLFGEDVSQQIRDIANANRLSKQCLTQTGGRARGSMRFRGSGRPNRGAFRGNWRYQPFLGRRQVPYNNFRQAQTNLAKIQKR